MVLVLAIPIRSIYGLEDFITEKHLDNCAKLMLATGQFVAYGYIIESFMAWYSGDIYDRYMIVDRMKGYYAVFYWLLLSLNILFVQVLWFRKVRKSPAMLFGASVLILAAMWLERFVIVVQSLHRDFLPSSWSEYLPTRWDISQYIGTIGLFAFGMLLFIRYLPMISIFEIRELLPEAHVQPVEAE